MTTACMRLHPAVLDLIACTGLGVDALSMERGCGQRQGDAARRPLRRHPLRPAPASGCASKRSQRAEYLAQMLAYYSVHVRFKGQVSMDQGAQVGNGKRSRLTQERDTAKLKWADVGAAVMVTRHLGRPTEDTLAAIAKCGMEQNIGFISTGGSAFLEVLEGKTLPACEILKKRANG